MPVQEQRLSISEAARLLDRSAHTLRSWDRNKSMPKHLRPKRDEHGHRYWTPELIEEIKRWMADNDFHPGRGIAYHPSPERLQEHIERIRRASNVRSGPVRNGSVISPYPDDPAAERLCAMIEEAIEAYEMTEAQIVAGLPGAIARLSEEGFEISLDRALVVTSSVFAARSHR